MGEWVEFRTSGLTSTTNQNFNFWGAGTAAPYKLLEMGGVVRFRTAGVTPTTPPLELWLFKETMTRSLGHSYILTTQRERNF